ncbi:DUF1707 domain-containing protein [Goekera deserti]|uniref:DUF1707 domain-containing protein n=1 Tax=Goekera deserti TaxID=2497753 RepID=A0A7K3WDK9_9ACTN|nr:DUF1707 domain-containing protein [Goekera deserti]NDI46501.1 DUF1707 domain-containing protein [Goekera deserti]NEL54565.1 DUF1707 domain-containing protein [Goekera deserti]
MRVSDGEREAVVGRLRVAMDEGRLDLYEYDRRIALAYQSVTYGDLEPLVADLPAGGLPPPPGLPAGGLPAAGLAASRSGAGPARVLTPGVVEDMHLSLKVLWAVWGAALTINLTVWLLVSLSTGDAAYFWPMWLLVPGVVLGGVTVGVHEVRRRSGPTHTGPSGTGRGLPAGGSSGPA